MPRQLKIAWYIVVVSLASFLTVGVLATVLGTAKALPGFALFAFVGLSPFLFREKRRPGEVAFDERDNVINRKAALAGAMASYLWFVLSCMIFWAILRHQGQTTVSINLLPEIVGIGGMILFFSHALATIVLYGRRTDDAGI